MGRLKVLSAAGARLQFIKASPVSDALRYDHDEVPVHAGQYCDKPMSGVFFDEFIIPESDYNLGVGSGGHAAQAAEMMTRPDGVVADEAPDAVLVYGDTNSTLVAALVAAKRDPALAHVEIGLRSRSRTMPGEANRALIDHCSDLLFAPSESAVETPMAEGIRDGVFVTGNVQYNAVLRVREAARRRPSMFDDLDLRDGGYVLTMVRRAINTDDRDRLGNIVEGLASSELPVVFPVHLRTEGALEASGSWSWLADTKDVVLVESVGYLDFVRLLDSAERVTTDSGGVQREVFYLDIRCLTFRDETKWTETVDAGWNVFAGADAATIRAVLADDDPLPEKSSLYGDGSAAERIVATLSEYGDA